MTYIRPMIELDAGETPDPFTFQVCDATGTPRDMTGATVTGELRLMGSATVTSTAGSVIGSILTWQAAAGVFDIAGTYLLTVTASVGAITVVQTIRIRVRDAA